MVWGRNLSFLKTGDLHLPSKESGDGVREREGMGVPTIGRQWKVSAIEPQSGSQVVALVFCIGAASFLYRVFHPNEICFYLVNEIVSLLPFLSFPSPLSFSKSWQVVLDFKNNPFFLNDFKLLLVLIPIGF